MTTCTTVQQQQQLGVIIFFINHVQAKWLTFFVRIFVKVTGLIRIDLYFIKTSKEKEQKR